MNAEQTYGLEELGRHTIDGVEFVLYTDGAYHHVVAADDWDREDWRPNETDPDDPSEITLDNYTEQFCRLAEFADDATSVMVARACGNDIVHSANGTCAVLSTDDDDAGIGTI